MSERVVEVEVPVTKVVEKEVVREVGVPVEKIVEVVKEVPAEKAVEKEVVNDLGGRRVSDTVPKGRELSKHTHEGQTYTIVDYGDNLAIFSPSGSPVIDARLANDVFHSYAWGRTLDGLDTSGMTSAAGVVRRIGDSIAGARDTSNEMVKVFDQLDALNTKVPLLGTVSAMDVIVEAYPLAAVASEAIRSLDDKLNRLGSNAEVLVGSIGRIAKANPSDVSGSEMDTLFEGSVLASRHIETSVRTAKSAVADIQNMAGALKEAIRQASDTPAMGQSIAEHSETVGRFEAELASLVDAMQSYEEILADLAGQFQAPLDSTHRAHEAYVGRWLQQPYDTAWRDSNEARSQTSTTQSADAQASISVAERRPFKLDWSASASSVESGQSFTLTVRMYDVLEAGHHGGISVSFPSLTGSGGSDGGHSSSFASVEALDYATGLSKVTFHQPGTTIYHKENDRRFAAWHLLVESDDDSWPRLEDRTLVLRITPKRTGEFRIRIRGWLCVDKYMDCTRNPATGTVEDQQGYKVVVATIAVSGR